MGVCWLFFDSGHEQWPVTAVSGRYSGGAFTSLAVDTNRPAPDLWRLSDVACPTDIRTR